MRVPRWELLSGQRSGRAFGGGLCIDGRGLSAADQILTPGGFTGASSPMTQDSAGLPREVADRFTSPLSRFLKIEAATGAVLLLATLAALMLSNSPWSISFVAFWKTP